MTEVPAKKSYATTILTLTGILALMIGLWTAVQLFQPPHALPTFASGTALPAPRPLTAFALTDSNGQPFDLERFKGAWTFLFFGYTHCPDVCPTTLVTLNSTVRLIAEAGSRHVPTRVVFVTVDPERDTVQHLAEYMPFFNKKFLGVTGTPAQIDAFTKQLNILHMRGSETAADGGYTVDHTASILLIDPRARLSAVFSPPHIAATLAQEFLSLRSYYEDQ